MIFTTNRPLKPLVMLLLALCLSACGGGSSGGGAAGGSGAGGTVETPNVAPTASAGEDQSVNEQTTVTLVGNGTDSDGSISAFAWSQTAGSSVTLTDASSASATFTTPTLIAPEQLTFSLTVTDNLGATGTDTLTVMVNPVNALPTAIAGEDQTAFSSSEITLTGSATDSDGTISTTVWTQISGATVALANADTTTATFTTHSTAGVYVFALTATDNEGGEATDTVIIDVQKFQLEHDQGSTDQFVAGTEVIFTVDGFSVGAQTSSWSYISDSNLTLSLSQTGSGVESVGFISLPVVTDQTVTIKVEVTELGIITNLEKTVTMLASNPMGFETVSVSNDVVTVTDTPQQLTSEDLTGDGYPELLMVQDGSMSMLVNKGAGLDSKADQYHTAITIDKAQSVRAHLLADMNNDGLKDIVVVSTTLKWLANAADDSRFTVESTIALPSNVSAIEAQVADMDNDGDMDVVVGYADSDNRSAMAVGWVEQTEPGVFTAMVVLDALLDTHWDTSPLVTIADFNGDNVNDIAVASTGPDDNRPIWLFINDGKAASFTRTIGAYMTGGGFSGSYSTRGFFHVDINQDGLADLVQWQTGTIFYNRSAYSSYYINQGDGSFTEHLLSIEGATNMKLFSKDVDGDGDLDIVHGINSSIFSCDIGSSCYFFTPGAIMWQENVEGSLSEKLSILGYSRSAYALEMDDIDNDGDLDVINADTNNAVLDLYINNTNP